jgi:hypothetical protein
MTAYLTRQEMNRMYFPAWEDGYEEKRLVEEERKKRGDETLKKKIEEQKRQVEEIRLKCAQRNNLQVDMTIMRHKNLMRDIPNGYMLLNRVNIGCPQCVRPECVCHVVDSEDDEQDLSADLVLEDNTTMTSEVLGPSAIHWINSEDKLLGGKRRQRKRGKRPKRRRRGVPTTINRSVFFAPPRLRTHLTFELRFTAPAATLLNPWSLEFINLTNPNMFTGVSTSVPGFTEWGGLYRKYRVGDGDFEYSTLNNDPFGVEMFSTPVNFQPSLTADPTKFLSMGGAKTKLISPKGGLDHGTVRNRASVSWFGGSATTTVEDAYVGTTDNTSPPADNLYFLYGFMTNGMATVTPALNVIKVHVTIDFFELQSPPT